MTVQEVYKKAEKINHIIETFETGKVNLASIEGFVPPANFYDDMIRALGEYETLLRIAEVNIYERNNN